MKESGLQLIPKYEKYIQYVLEIIIKMPRVEKFNIGNEFKNSMYQTLENILYIEKIDKYQRLYYLNIIDTKISYQRILLRIMKKNKWIDERKFKISMEHIYEIGKILGGLIKYYACIKNRGIHKSAIYVQEKMKHCRRIWGEYYILKMDIAKYFDNINKNILLKILKRKIKDKDLLWLINEILFAQKREKGLEIGNYTSQMFANIYLNEVDQYIKHKLKVKYYCRYLDDSVLMVKSKKEAKEILENIKIFLKENLELELNKKTQIFKNKQGVNFCGYKINEYRMKIRDKGKRKLKKKVKHLKVNIKEGNLTSKEAKKYLTGHLGYIKIADTYNLESKLFYNE